VASHGAKMKIRHQWFDDIYQQNHTYAGQNEYFT
jgi:hypothetical protein